MGKILKDKTITMRIETELLNDFKKVCKNCSYQQKVRELMRSYIADMDRENTKRIIKDKSINTDFLTK